jgi:hypothetical protein
MPDKSLRAAGLTSFNQSSSSKSDSPTTLTKRMKQDFEERKVIVISDSEEAAPVPSTKQTAKQSAGENLDLAGTLKFFRLDPKKLGFVQAPPFLLIIINDCVAAKSSIKFFTLHLMSL